MKYISQGYDGIGEVLEVMPFRVGEIYRTRSGATRDKPYNVVKIVHMDGDVFWVRFEDDPRLGDALVKTGYLRPKKRFSCSFAGAVMDANRRPIDGRPVYEVGDTCQGDEVVYASLEEFVVASGKGLEVHPQPKPAKKPTQGVLKAKDRADILEAWVRKL